MNNMYVIKRNGMREEVEFDKILNRIKKLGQEVNLDLNYQSLAIKVIDQLYDNIATTKIDELTAEQCAVMSTNHPDYGILAGRVLISNHHKNTDASFYNSMEKLYNFYDDKGNHKPFLSNEFWNFVEKNANILDNMIDYSRDYNIDYFGFKTLERAYLYKINNKIIERPQHMWMRVAVGIHGINLSPNLDENLNKEILDLIKETYDLMSLKYFTHATPTLFNAGTIKPQLSSCYLIAMEDDSLDGIFNTLHDCAMISKYAGGIGLHIHNIRAKGTHIQGTNGVSNGIVPMLRVFNNTAKYVDQCLDPNTIVYSKRGPIAIKNIVIGDKVITDDGNMYSIRKVLDYNYFGDIYKLNIKHTIQPLIATDMHPLWVIKNNNFCQTKFTNIINELDRNLIKSEFIEVKNITKNDFIGFPIPKYEKDIPYYTDDDCRMYGILLGDGNISSVKNSAYVSLNKETKKETITFVENYLSKLNIRITYIYINDKNIRLVWTRTNMFKFTYEMLYDVNKEKKIMCQILHLPKNKILNIIKGILETDGKVSNHQIVLEITSQSIVEGVRYMLLRLGILTSGTNRNRIDQQHETKYGKIIKNKKISYILIVPKKPIICNLFPEKGLIPSETFTFFEYNNFLYSIVIENELIENYSGRVIDIEVDNENHHNFLTHNGLVKNGGGKRNGSFAIYLEPWHADIEDFLEMRKNHGDEELKARDLFYAIWMNDLFMERVKSNDKWSLFCPNECPGLSDVYGEEFNKLYTHYENENKIRKSIPARELWFKILDAQMETGTPYIVYKDHANNKSNQKNIGIIKSSNLCVAPETNILTLTGHVEIKTLVDKEVDIWNGKEFSKVIIRKTGEDQELIDVFTDDGSKLSCTPYHKFYIQENYSEKSIKQVEAKDLKPDDKLIKCSFPVIDGNNKFLYPYTHGFFCGDGSYSNVSDNPERECKFKALNGHFFCKRHIDYETEEYLLNNDVDLKENISCLAKSYSKKPIIYLYGVKKELLQYMNYRTFTENNGKMILQLPLDIEEKFNIPSHNCCIKDKLDWFAGYCDADGSICKNGDNEQLQVSSINYEFLQSVKLFLQTCGINPKIRLSNNREKNYLPDGKGGYKYYNVKPIYRLLVTSYDLYQLVQLGFSPKRLKIIGNKPARNACQFIKILKIENNNRIDDTYCFTEPKRHMGIFNGIITSQCSEIIQYSDTNETAVCNLASIALPTFVNNKTKEFDYEKLHYVSKVITNNLNKVIDINYYPTNKTRVSNMKHRPIGIGVQGLADVFILMDIAYHSDEAKEINKNIFETIYHASLEKSNEISIYRKEQLSKYNIENLNELNILNEYELKINDNKYIGSYSSFKGSPASQGLLQFDLWNISPSNRYDWNKLKKSICEHGIRNSLLLAPMPTASTSQILGFNECFEPLTSNIYSRRTLAGEFIVLNKYLMRELIELGYWNENIKNNIIANKGSIQQLTFLSEHIRNKYKIVWEMPMKHLIDLAADRGAFICQSQSLNLWLEDPNYSILTSMHFYAWNKGLKTGIYYLRRKAKHQAQQFTIEPEEKNNNIDTNQICESCSA